MNDEINMLEDTGKVFTYNKREKSILAASTNDFDMVILDDGFQDISIKSDFSIICFSSKLIG